MAKMTSYRPACDMKDCGHRATYEIESDNGRKSLWCGSHVKKALFDIVKYEDYAQATPTLTKQAV